MERSEKRTLLAIQTLHGLSPDILIGGADIEHRLSLRISQPENLMDVPGDLTEELFALTQVRSPLQDSFAERAIPPHQDRDEQERPRRRVTREDEVARIHVDRAKPLFVDLLHPARPEWHDDFVEPAARAGSEGHESVWEEFYSRRWARGTVVTCQIGGEEKQTVARSTGGVSNCRALGGNAIKRSGGRGWANPTRRAVR